MSPAKYAARVRATLPAQLWMDDRERDKANSKMRKLQVPGAIPSKPASNNSEINKTYVDSSSNKGPEFVATSMMQPDEEVTPAPNVVRLEGASSTFVIG